MNYFFDENFAPSLAKAVQCLHARDYPYDKADSWKDRDFGGMKDEPWINALAKTQLEWTILTMDHMRHEREAVQESSFTWFLFAKGWATLSFWQQAWRIIKIWPALVSEGRKSKGDVFTISVNGKINKVSPR